MGIDPVAFTLREQEEEQERRNEEYRALQEGVDAGAEAVPFSPVSPGAVGPAPRVETASPELQAERADEFKAMTEAKDLPADHFGRFTIRDPMTRGGRPAFDRRAGLSEEERNLPLGETLIRGGRVYLGQAVGPGGAMGAIAGGVGAFQWLDQQQKLIDEVFGYERESLFERGMEQGGKYQDWVQGDILPYGDSEEWLGKFGQEAGASAVLAGPGRRFALSAVRRGTAGRFLQGIADEPWWYFAGGEVLGAGGAATGRMAAEDAGVLAEMGAALGGDFAVRTLPLYVLRTARGIHKRLRVRFEDPDAQEARMHREIFSRIRKEGGFLEMLRDPKKHHIIMEFADALQRQAGGRVRSLEAVRKMDEMSEILRRNGIDPGTDEAAAHYRQLMRDDPDFQEPAGVTAGALTRNEGIMAQEKHAAAINPELSMHMAGLLEPGSEAVRRTMVDLGPPRLSSQFDAVQANVRNTADAELKAADAEISALMAQADEILGGFTKAGDADAVRIELAEKMHEILVASYKRARAAPNGVNAAYQSVREYAKAHPYIRWETKNTKRALTEVLEELGEFGEKLLPAEHIQDVRRLEATASYKELESMSNTLGIVAEQFAKDPNKPGTIAHHLRTLKEAVDADLDDIEVVISKDRLPKPPAADQTVARQTDEQAELIRQRSAEKYVEDIKEIHEQFDAAHPPEKPFEMPSLKEMEVAPEAPAPGVPPKPKGERGTVGVGAVSEDTTFNLAVEETRKEMVRRLRVAKEANTELANVYFDKSLPASRKIILGERYHNPVHHSETLGMYLTPGKGYAERIQDLIIRTRNEPEVLELAEKWLLADAYHAAVTTTKDNPVPALQRTLLDGWRKKHAPALRAFPDVEKKIAKGSGWLDEARDLGSKASQFESRQSAAALSRYGVDPEAFWGTVVSRGEHVGMREIDDVINRVMASGDQAAIAGLKSSLWEHLLIDGFSKKGAEFDTPQLAMSTIRKALGKPHIRKTVAKLFGDDHVERLKELAQTQTAVEVSAAVPAGVRSEAMKTGREQMKRFATSASVFSVILGPIRRTFKVGKALDDLARSMDQQQIGALFVEAMRNPALLRDGLKLNPSLAVINRIKNRLTLNWPTLFPRVPAVKEYEEQRPESRPGYRTLPPAKEREEETANRAFVAPPTVGLLRPPNAALGRFG